MTSCQRPTFFYLLKEMDRLLIKLPSLILLAEKTYSSGATKKETVIQACNSFLTPEQPVVLDPILNLVIIQGFEKLSLNGLH